MNTWILIITIWGGPSYNHDGIYKSPHIEAIEFDTKTRCLSTAYKYKTEANTLKRKNKIDVMCVEK